MFSSTPESLPHSSDPARKEKPPAQITTKVRRLPALPEDFPARAAWVHFPSLHHDCGVGAAIPAVMGYFIIHHSTGPHPLSPTACGVIIRASINSVPHFRMSTVTASLHGATSQFVKNNKVPVIEASNTVLHLSELADWPVRRTTRSANITLNGVYVRGNLQTGVIDVHRHFYDRCLPLAFHLQRAAGVLESFHREQLLAMATSIVWEP